MSNVAFSFPIVTLGPFPPLGCSLDVFTCGLDFDQRADETVNVLKRMTRATATKRALNNTRLIANRAEGNGPLQPWPVPGLLGSFHGLAVWGSICGEVLMVKK